MSRIIADGLSDRARATVVSSHETAYDHTTYDVAVLEQKRQALLDEATLCSDFANGDYRLWEGVDKGIVRGKAFSDLFTHTRSSTATGWGVGKLGTAGVDTKRLVRDPETGKSQGLLIEEQRTNLLLWSEDFTQNYWIKNGSSVSASPMASPINGVNYNEITQGSGTPETSIQRIETLNTPHVAAFFVKKKDWRYCYVQIGASFRTYLDFDTGETSVIGGSGGAVPLYDGSYLIWVSGTPSGTAGVRVGHAGSLSTSTIVGDGVSALYAVGAQLEQGSAPSSYIPTEGAQVTRASDLVSRTLGAEFNPSKFSIVLNNVRLEGDASATQRPLTISDGTNNNRVSIARTLLVTSLSGTPTSYSNVVSIPNDSHIALSWDGSILTIYVNGIEWFSASVNIDTSTFNTLIAGNTSFSIGVARFGGVSVFPYSLSESELQILTNPEA